MYDLIEDKLAKNGSPFNTPFHHKNTAITQHKLLYKRLAAKAVVVQGSKPEAADKEMLD